MPQYRVTAQRLNKRKFIPKQFPEPLGIVGVVNKDFSFEGEEVAEENNPNSKLGKWYIDRNKNFYWGAGLDIVPQYVSFNADKMSWAHESVENGGLGIVDFWNLTKSKGRGVKVTIIDTGIGSSIPDLNNVIKQIYAPSDGGNVVANDPHGSLTAGVIGATGKSIAYGIAPECSITMIKNDGLAGPTEENTFAALQAVGQDVDILNLSFACSDTKRINDEINRIANQGTLIIAATDDGVSKLNNTIFPANHPKVIPVTALNTAQGLYWQALFNSNTKWILPGEHILSCGIDGRVAWHDATSAAAPVMSGLLALFIGLRQQAELSFTNKQLFEQLSATAKTVPFNQNDKTYTFYLPNPLNAYNNLKNLNK